VASHDLQEPLRKVASYVDILNRYYKNNVTDDSERYTAHIIDGVMRMQSLIHGLLAYSRVDREDQHIGPTDCASVVADVLADLQPAIQETGAEVAVGALPVVNGDRTQLAQLFQNLIGNALKFRDDEPPRIEIGAENLGKDWRFFVKDNGVGLDPAFADRIFVIFQRLHSRDAYPGTGIGLAICKKIVERHGGRIWVESQGKGATFFFTLRSRVETATGRTNGASRSSPAKRPFFLGPGIDI
jgi:light-regulated signal transduction histidine kinase (bacteriophytochrome)